MKFREWLGSRWPLFSAILLVGAFVRLKGLGAESLWLDEAWTWGLVRDGAATLLDRLAHHDAHPPLYFLIVRIFTSLFGASEAVLRLPSALAGIAALPLLYRFASRIGDKETGLLAMLLLAISPFHVFFSQEARSYALLLLLCLASLDLLFGLRTAPSRGRWAGFAALTAGIMLTHYMGAFFILSEAAVAALLFRDRPGFLRELALSLAGSLVLYLPWLPTALTHMAGIDRGFWIPKPTWPILGVALYNLVSHVYHPGVPRAALAVLPFYLLLILVPLRDRRRETLALLLLFALPIAGEFLVSMRRPVFYTRTFLHVLIPLWTLAARGAFLLPRRYAWAAAVFLSVGLAPSTLFLHRTAEKEDFRGAAALLESTSAPDERIVVQEGFVAMGLDYYSPRLDRVLRVDSGTLLSPGTPRADIEREIRGSAAGVWLVFRYGQDGGWPAALASDFERQGAWKSAGIEVHYLRRRAVK